MLDDPGTIAVAGVCAFGAIVISIFQILCHLRNYTEPVFQRYIIRLIFMVPVYAIGSWFSLKYRNAAIYFDTIRDCYEAWIIYNFTSLLLAYVGGPGAVVVKAEGKVVHPSWTHLTCCLPAMQVDGFFLRRCKQGTLQFVLLKPIMAALTLILYAAGAYTDGDMSPRNGYFYISILYNICYTLALYGLMLFWIGAAELLEPFNPLLKFILVKTVVFLTFWQGIAISMINSMGRIRDPEDGKALQNFMICVEMLLAGVAMIYAFPYKQYSIGGTATGFRLDAVAHAISISDVIKDTIHAFFPTYSDYVLYSDGGPADNVKRKKFRGQKGTDAPKSSLVKSMAKNGLAGLDGVFEAAGGLAAGRKSKTPKPSASKAEKAMERNRNMAILLDSDSDAMDSEEEGGGHLGTMVASDSDSDHNFTHSEAGGSPRSPSSPRTADRPCSGAAKLSTTGGGGGAGGAAGHGTLPPLRRRLRLLSSSDEDDGDAVSEGDDESEGEGTGASSRPRSASRQQQQGACTQASGGHMQPHALCAPAPQLPPQRSAAREKAALQAVRQPAAPAGERADAYDSSSSSSGGRISLPLPKSATQRMAEAKVAAPVAAAEGAEEQLPAWAASGWEDEAAIKRSSTGGARGSSNGGSWAADGWTNVPV